VINLILGWKLFLKPISWASSVGFCRILPESSKLNLSKEWCQWWWCGSVMLKEEPSLCGRNECNAIATNVIATMSLVWTRTFPVATIGKEIPTWFGIGWLLGTISYWLRMWDGAFSTVGIVLCSKDTYWMVLVPLCSIGMRPVRTIQGFHRTACQCRMCWKIHRQLAYQWCMLWECQWSTILVLSWMYGVLLGVLIRSRMEPNRVLREDAVICQEISLPGDCLEHK